MNHVMRPARVDESDDVAALVRLSRRTALPYLRDLHTPTEDRAFFRDIVFAACEVWVAHDGEMLTGVCALRDGWIDHLYVHPDYQRRGIGGALLRKAMKLQERLELWTFQRNTAARRFYEAHGFRRVGLTTGDNEEREPDVKYEWSRVSSA